MKRRSFLAIVAATLSLAGCGPPAHPANSSVQSNAAEPHEPPDLWVIAGQRSIPTVRGTYAWSWRDGGQTAHVVADSPGWAALFERDRITPTALNPGTQFWLAFAVPPPPSKVRVHEIGEGGRISVAMTSDGLLIAPRGPGVHTYEVRASWEQGGAAYAFQIEVS